MVASYPGTIRVFTSKTDIVDTVYADHPNSLQDEVVAVQTTLGLNPQISTTPNPSGSFNAVSTNYASLAARLANIETGILADTHNQYLKKGGGDVVQSAAASTIPLRLRGAANQSADMLQLLSGAGTTVAAFSADGSLSVNNLTVNGTQTNVAGSATALDLGATTGIAAGTGANFGDKIQLYQSTFGFGVQSNRMVAWLPANAGFAVRLKSNSGYASGGTDAVVLGSDGSVTASGTGNFLDVQAAGNSLARGLISYTHTASFTSGVTSTETDINNCGAISFTVSGTRTVYVNGQFNCNSTVPGDEIRVVLYLDGAQMTFAYGTMGNPPRNITFTPSFAAEVTNGSHTVRATITRRQGTGTTVSQSGPGEGVYIFDAG